MPCQYVEQTWTALHRALTFLLSAVDTGLNCMEDVRDVIELVGESTDRAGLCNVGPSARSEGI